MQLFKVKWERIITLMYMVTTIYTWIVYFKYVTDIKMLALATISTLALMTSIISYNGIKEFRHEVIKSWK